MTVALRRDLVVAAWITAFLAVTGAALGLLAAALTPHVAMSLFEDASVGYPKPVFLQVVEEDRAAFGGDAVMIAVLAGAGVVVGVLGLLLGRRVPAGTIVGILAGGVAAGLIAMAVQHHVLHPAYAGVPVSQAGQGVVHQLRPYVRGSADFAVLPFIAALVWFAGQVPWLLRGGDARRAEMAGFSSGTADSA
jgi:hypothetical protein